MNYRIGIIGDVHGELKAFKKLIKKLEKHGVDRIISVGDLVDRGPDSQGCVELVRTRGFTKSDGTRGDIEMILGNHEDSHLRVYLGIPWPGETTVWKTNRHMDVYDTFKKADWDFLLKQKFMLRDERLDVTVLHGGVMPEDKSLGWMSRDRVSLTSRTGYIGAKGERMKPGHSSNEFWTEQYDGRFGRVVYGHTTFDEVRFTKNTVGVDGSKKGKLLAIVIGEGEKDKTFEVKAFEFKPYVAKKTTYKTPSYYAQDNFSWTNTASWDDAPAWDEPKKKLTPEDKKFNELFMSMKRGTARKKRKAVPPARAKFESGQELWDRVNRK